MKSFLIISLCFLAAITKARGDFSMDDLKKFMEITESCRLETGASTQDVETFAKHQPSVTHEGKCLRACIMQKLFIMNPDGGINVAAIMEIGQKITNNSPEQMQIGLEAVQECVAVQVSDPCENSDTFGTCMKRALKARNFGFDW